jgi:ribokinase
MASRVGGGLRHLAQQDYPELINEGEPESITMQSHLVVVGSINMDLVFRTPHMPAVGETVMGNGFRQAGGGKGANQAIAAARMGAAVKMVGAVGDDAFGMQLLQGLAQDGIDLALVAVVAGSASGIAGIFVDRAGSNAIVVAPGANDHVCVQDIAAAREAIASADLLICQLEVPAAAVRAAMRIAKLHHTKVILNPSPAHAVDAALLAGVDYLILNETEAAQLSGINVDHEAGAVLAAERLMAHGLKALLLTMGARGVLVVTAEKREFMPAVKVDAVDTTAAGDTFVGAFAAALMRGEHVHAAAAEAQYAAAIAVTRNGAQEAIPNRGELEHFFRRQGPALP